METNLNEQNKTKKPSSILSKVLKLKIIIPVIIAALLLTVTFSIVMAKKKFGDGPGGGFMMGMLIEKLDLNETQKAQVEKIRDEIHARMETKRDGHQTMMEDFASEFNKDNMDKNKLMELDQKRQEDMMANKEFMMDKMIEFHNILTPQQRQQAVDLMKDRKGRFGRGMRGGPNCQDCPNCPNGKKGPNGPNGNRWNNDREN